MAHASNPKPSKPYDHKIDAFAGRQMEVHHDNRLSGVWMAVGGTPTALEGPNLHLVAHAEGGGMWYAGYRDGIAGPDKLAISVDLAGEVMIQVVRGHSDAKFISLAELERIVFDGANKPLPA
jgi:hypothetical protein